MPKIHVTDSQGAETTMDANAGGSLMESLVDEGYEEIEAVCGGCCSCATCHVYIDPGWRETVGAAHEDESELLAELDTRQENSRLSCQIPVTDALNGLKIVLPETA